MGRDTDTLSIISMNGKGRKGRYTWECKRRLLDGIIEDEQPHIMFLPGDDQGPDSMAFKSYSYSQLLESSQSGTVLLYDHSKLQAKPLEKVVVPKLDTSKLVFSEISVLSPAPMQSVVKSFHALTWHWELMETTSQEIYQSGQQLLMASQYIASVTGTEILIGGDLNLPIHKIKELLQQHNNLVAQGLDQLKPAFRDMGYMDCMTDNVLSPGRRLRQLRLHQSDNKTDYFIASKEMQIMKTETISLERLEKTFSVMKTNIKPSIVLPSQERPILPNSTCTTEASFCPQPVKSQVYIPPRPPKHHGG